MKRLWALLIFVGVIASVGAEDSPTIHAVEFFEREVMEAAFAKGQRLATSSNYNVSASRRDKVGTSEIQET